MSLWLKVARKESAKEGVGAYCARRREHTTRTCSTGTAGPCDHATMRPWGHASIGDGARAPFGAATKVVAGSAIRDIVIRICLSWGSVSATP